MDSSVIINKNIVKEFDLTKKLSTYKNILSEFSKISAKIKSNLKSKCIVEDKIDPRLFEQNQFICHGYAWFETYRISLEHTFNWFNDLCTSGESSKLEQLVLASAFSEYSLQMRDGIMMSQSEIIRPLKNFDLEPSDFDFLNSKETKELIDYGLTEEVKFGIVDFLDKGQFPKLGLKDET